MSNVIAFPDPYDRATRKLDPESKRFVDGCMRRLLRERARRERMIAAGQLSERWLEVLPLFKLTAVSRPRTCDNCRSRIEPGEIHFVVDGVACCQRITCTKESLGG